MTPRIGLGPIEFLQASRLVRDQPVDELGPLAMPAIVLGVLAERVDGHARPTEPLFQIEGRRVPLPVTGAHVEKNAVSAIAKKIADDQLFVILRIDFGPFLQNGRDRRARRIEDDQRER